MNTRKLFLASVMIFSAAALPAHAEISWSIGIGINSPPPPPPPQVIYPPPQRHGYIWSPGYWHWTGHRHVWVDGYWIAARSGYEWEPDHWHKVGHYYHFKPGHWKKMHPPHVHHHVHHIHHIQHDSRKHYRKPAAYKYKHEYREDEDDDHDEGYYRKYGHGYNKAAYRDREHRRDR